MSIRNEIIRWLEQNIPSHLGDQQSLSIVEAEKDGQILIDLIEVHSDKPSAFIGNPQLTLYAGHFSFLWNPEYPWNTFLYKRTGSGHASWHMPSRT